jgi:hypothetical protein
MREFGKMTFGLVAVFATLLAAGLPGAEAGYFIKSVHSGKYVDAAYSGWANGQPQVRPNDYVVQWDLHGGSNQRWELVYLNNGYYKIASKNNPDLVLDLQAWNNGSPVTMTRFAWYVEQQWKLEYVYTPPPPGGWLGSYSYVIRNRSGKVLDVSGWSTSNGTILSQYTYHGGANQRWILVPESHIDNPPR